MLLYDTWHICLLCTNEVVMTVSLSPVRSSKHMFNFQLLFTEGRRHDAGILADSNLLHSLEQHAYNSNGNPVCLYGDPAYPLRMHLQVPFRQNGLTPAMEDFNVSMSRVRESVEWIFGDVLTSFKALDFKINLKVGLSSVGKMYVVCALIQNAITCLYRNQTSKFFELEPPALADYFR